MVLKMVTGAYYLGCTPMTNNCEVTVLDYNLKTLFAYRNAQNSQGCILIKEIV